MTDCEMSTVLAAVFGKLAKEGFLGTPGPIQVGVSNRHVHLNREAMDVLFGPGSTLTRRKDLGQPGQYAAEETLTLRGPKGEIKRVRVLGPLRAQCQVEITVSDGYRLGVQAPVRDSGDLEGTPGVELVGPNGVLPIKQGVIVAGRHIHMTPVDAAIYGVKDRQVVSAQIEGPRGALLRNVLIRVSNASGLEMHIDVEEANAVGAVNGTPAKLILT
jgi:propanediol utilization protein